MNIRDRHRLASAGTAAVVLLLSTACSGGSPDTTTSPTVDTTTVTVSADEATAPTGTAIDETPSASAPAGSVPSDRLPLTAPPVGASLTITDIRVGEHRGFDRVVVEFHGTGTPGYDLRFTDDPRQDGSGAPVAVPGRSVIQMVINGVTYPTESGVPEYAGPNPVPGVGQITEVNKSSVFEGQARLFVGVDADEPAVRVSTLTSPTRLVLDIAR